jgi:hypothetical protein
MFRRGLALCLAFGFASIANAATNITLVKIPNKATYTPGENVSVDVVLSQDTGVDRLVRFIQIDVSASNASLLAGATYPTQSGETIGFWDCPGSCDTNHLVEPIPTGDRTNVGSVAYLGLSANAGEQIVLPGDGSGVIIGSIDLVMPAEGNYTLNVVNATGADPDEGSEVRWGFGVLGGDDLTRCRADGNSVNCVGGLTGGTTSFEVVAGGGEVTVRDAFPFPDNTTGIANLWRTTSHVIRIRFNGDITAPAEGQILIRQLLAGGTFGADVSSNFTFVVENDENSLPRVLRIQDNGNNLVDRAWYGVENNGWAGVEAFDLHFRQAAGNSNNDNFVNALDLADINSRVFPTPRGGTFSWTNALTQSDYRKNINADNFVNALDLAAANGKVFPLALPNKPSGH